MLYTFNQNQPLCYLITSEPTKVLYRNVTREGVYYKEVSVKDEHRIPIDFNCDVLGFTLQLKKSTNPLINFVNNFVGR